MYDWVHSSEWFFAWSQERARLAQAQVFTPPARASPPPPQSARKAAGALDAEAADADAERPFVRVDVNNSDLRPAAAKGDDPLSAPLLPMAGDGAGAGAGGERRPSVHAMGFGAGGERISKCTEFARYERALAMSWA